MLWFDIDESDPAWDELRQLVPEWSAEDGCDPENFGIAHTEFSSAELKLATYLKIGAWLHGYPQPEDDFGYRKATYDLSDFCSACGIGKKQIAPFRMKGEPKWGTRHILQMNWVFDQFFVRPEVWNDVFEPFGIGFRQVVNHRNGADLTSVVQLDITARVQTRCMNNPSEDCPACGRKKYFPVTRGMFPAIDEIAPAHAAKSIEYFGSGASAWNAVLISARLFQAIQKARLKGAVFTPVEDAKSKATERR
jgi:hypothetical protein